MENKKKKTVQNNKKLQALVRVDRTSIEAQWLEAQKNKSASLHRALRIVALAFGTADLNELANALADRALSERLKQAYTGSTPGIQTDEALPPKNVSKHKLEIEIEKDERQISNIQKQHLEKENVEQSDEPIPEKPSAVNSNNTAQASPVDLLSDI
ncbi:hypothetical protein [Limosilactobacillus ingluviei]|uniref:hypothetical protein n=1 Tax=Limosilactobacillus ingluviei TaxID=148604 RepID=UPI00070509AB|nr:hypothetical protein [Limosilactobacillus ingluviei]